jgi:hypothetical protein
MDYIEFISSEQSWLETITKILAHKAYIKFNQQYLSDFKLPIKRELKKHNTKKTRTVYVYTGYGMALLKLTAFYILQKYNDKFCENSIAYTRGRSVKTAFTLLKSYKLKPNDTVYKNDFTDYFNSIRVDRLEDKVRIFLEDDQELCDFIIQILKEPRVKSRGAIIEVPTKGVMAGSPISGILANIYMDDIDKQMLAKGYKYIRYADDTLIVGEEALEYFKSQIKLLDIKLNPKKEEIMNIRDGIDFLGFTFKKGTIDISEKAKDKMKSRLKRRAKWYRQWMLKRNVKKEVAIRDYIKKINYKLFSDQDDSINWSRWYLPNINTKKTLKYLDNYFVDCIRYLDSGTWTKGKSFYRLSYKDIKKLGFRSLVNEYYKRSVW